MTQYTRYNDFDIPRPPLEFGIRWDTTNPDPVTSITRVGDAIGMSVNIGATPHVSDFDAFWPWAGMKRLIMSFTGDKYFYWGETDEGGLPLYNDSPPGKRAMVEVPKYWIKFAIDGQYRYFYISPFKKPGYRIHPAFLRASNGIINNFYVGSYEGVNSSGQLDSSANSTVWGDQTRAQYRTGAQNVGDNWQVIDWYMWNALQWLLVVEYARLDLQNVFPGLTHASGVKTTGYTSAFGPTGCVDLGNGSGNVLIPTTDDYASSWRGVENFTGNTKTILEAVGFDTAGRMWLNSGWGPYSDTFDAAHNFAPMAITLPTVSGFINSIWYDAYYTEGLWLLVPLATGGSATTYLCDKYTVIDFSAPRIPRVGGAYDSSTDAGPFNLDVSLAVAGHDAKTSTRLAFTPWDSTKYYAY